MAIVLPSTWGRDPPGRLPWGVTRGLTNRWPLDDASCEIKVSTGIVYDIVGTAYGTCNSAVPLSADGPNGSRGLQFTVGGSTDTAISLPADPTGGVTFPLTISLWINPTSYDSPDAVGTDARFLCIGLSTTNTLMAFSSAAGTLLQVSMTNASGEWTQSPSPCPLNQWTHIAVTLASASATTQVYINGVNAGATGAGHGATLNMGFYSFGGRTTTAGATDRSLQGSMADIRFYTGTVLTADEINQLYKSAIIQDPGYGYTLPDEGEMPALFTPAAPPPVAQATALGFIEVEW